MQAKGAARGIFMAGACALAMALAACTPEAQDSLTRDAARSAVTPVLLEKFPGVPLELALDCVIDNATSRELLSLAADAVTGPNANTAKIVGDVASRPATLKCLVASGLPALL